VTASSRTSNWLIATRRAGINWASMLEIALRSLSWVWALHLFVETDEPDPMPAPTESWPWTIDLLLGLHRQLSLVERNLSTYFSPNTHLLGRRSGVAGRVLPELAHARRWAERGRSVLTGEIGRQILADGGHAERSLHYHRYTLDFYLLALAVARVTDDAPAAAAFGEAALQLARFARAVADHRQTLPHVGDDDGGQLFPMCGTDAADAGESLALAARLLDRPELSDGRPREAVAWMTGTLTMTSPARSGTSSTALTASGYLVSCSSRRDHLVMDVGPLGYLNGGHAHSDALSLTLSVAGRPLLVDPGTGCYTIDPVVRDRFRSTAFHNTLTIDGRSQSTPAGPFHWSSAAQAKLHAWRSDRAFDFIEASHDGYRPVSHARQVVSRPGLWIVVDWVTGGASHRAEGHWHLDPAWGVSDVTGGRARIDAADGSLVWLTCLGAELEAIHGSAATELGWYAPAYGRLRPTTTLRARRSDDTPFSIVTVIADAVGPIRLDWLGEREMRNPVAWLFVSRPPTGWKPRAWPPLTRSRWPAQDASAAGAAPFRPMRACSSSGNALTGRSPTWTTDASRVETSDGAPCAGAGGPFCTPISGR
jgi:hypothetical protein